jgi:glycerol-1-phosphate dehydrogenase [NAD(P)+]
MIGQATSGLSGSRQARPAREISIRYGSQSLARDSAECPRYLAITSPTAHQVAKPNLSRQPAGVAHIESLDYAYLQETAARLPDDVELVVGLGGGKVLDAAKHVAAAKGLPVIQVPTIVSTGAIIHGYCGTFQGSTLIGDRDDWVWADCEYVLIDYELVLEAPAHLNTAGLGDVLCECSGIAEWRRNQRSSTGKIPHHDALERLVSFHARIARDFPATLNQQQNLTEDSIHLIVQTLQERDDFRVSIPTAPNVEHQFLAALEATANRTFIHGATVALGGLIISWHCEETPAAFAAILERCRVRWRPGDLGIGRDELRRGLSRLTEDLSKVRGAPEYNSVMRAAPIDDKRFGELWDFLTTKPDRAAVENVLTSWPSTVHEAQ